MTVPDLVSRLRAAGCVFAEDEARLIDEAAGSAADRETMARRRVAGDPLEYVVGFVDFCGLRLALDAGVFIPRQRTEFLVHEAAARTSPDDVVLDLCCGCGALGAALHRVVGGVELHASDIESRAVACARRNVPGAVYEGDLFAPLPDRLRGRVRTLLANVPYVPTAEIAAMPAEARDHEPGVTHDGGPDGLDVLRRVLADASQWLAPGGHLLVETSRQQADAAVRAFAAAGLEAAIAESAEYRATVVVGRA